MAGACPAFPEVGWRMDVFSSAGQSPAPLRSCCHPARGRTNIQRSLLLPSWDRPGRDPVKGILGVFSHRSCFRTSCS